MLSPRGNHDFIHRPGSGNLVLCRMEWMYDHFYKVLWKLLVRANRIPRAGGGASRSFKDGEPVRGAGYVLAFAGCSQGDGASTIAYNFACAFASYSSRSVLLVDGNVRQPVLHLQFPDEKQVGLTDLAEGQSSVEDAVLEITPGRYYFLRSGARSVNPVMLFESEDFFSVMEQLRARYDVVIFDCPPLLDNPEAILLANATDGLIMILQAEKTRWEAALAAVKDLESARIPVLGAILNKKQITPEPLSRLL